MNEVEISKFIHEAVKSGDIEQVSSLIGNSKDRLNEMTPFGSWLHIAAKLGHIELVQFLRSIGADMNVKGGTFGGAPINLAAGYGQPHVVQWLLAEGAELDVSQPKRNPLFSAIQGGYLEIVKLLVQSGLDYRVRYSGPSMKNMDALAFAQERGQSEIAGYLAQLA